jgi:hypothetical protein
MKQENFGFTSFLSYNMKKTHFMTLKSPFMTNKWPLMTEKMTFPEHFWRIFVVLSRLH